MEASFSVRKRSAQRPLVHRRSVPTRISKLNLRSASDDVITLPPAGGPALDFFWSTKVSASQNGEVLCRGPKVAHASIQGCTT